MKIRIVKIVFSTVCAVALLGALTEVQAANITSTGSGNWNSTTAGAPWPGGTVPALSDTVIIAGGSAVTNTDNRTLTGAVTVNSGGALTVSAGVTVAFNYGSGLDLTVASGGVLNNSGSVSAGFSSGNCVSCGGAITNSAGATFTTAGNITIAGTFDNLGTVSVNYASAAPLLGLGQFINDANATLNIKTGGGNPSITTLTTTAANNTVNYTTSGKTALAHTYVNLGLVGGGTMSASGSTVTGNLTVGSLVTGALTFPVSPIGGTLTYSGSGSSTFPSGYSIGGLNQSAGTLTVSSGQILTVTGTGAGTWTISAGTFTANATSTVKFTGAAPDIGGAVATAFGKLLIDSTATSATASGSGFAINTALTINPSGQLDISALSGSSLTLGASASLTNSGTIKGSIVTGATGKVFAGTDGGYGTSTIALTPSTGDLNLTSGSTVNLDVNTTAAGANDKLVVGGTLTLNSAVFNLKAPSNGATIDTADYTLATAGTISGTPVLNWVTGFVPANSGNYALVVSGGTVTLHNTGGVPVGSPVLSAVVNGSTLTLSWDSTTFPGYNVQAQTNSASVGLGSNWSDTGSGTVSPYPTTIDPANPTVFYRLAHP
jgi:hypothetical protein